jgi:hypothetical protein
MDLTKENERTALILIAPEEANADTVSFAQRTTFNETTVGMEGKPISKQTCLTSTVTRVIVDDNEPPTHDPRLDKSKSAKIRSIKCK